MHDELLKLENNAFKGLKELENNVKAQKNRESESYDPKQQIANMLNDYTYQIYDKAAYAWKQLEKNYWQMFGMGF